MEEHPHLSLETVVAHASRYFGPGDPVPGGHRWTFQRRRPSTPLVITALGGPARIMIEVGILDHEGREPRPCVQATIKSLAALEEMIAAIFSGSRPEFDEREQD